MRFWTVEEAEAELPRVRDLVELVQRFVQSATDPGTVAGGPGAGAPAVPPRERVEGVMAELDDKGIVFRDPSTGLIDFPSVGPDGAIRYLCWQPADGDSLSWWHTPDEGFAGRKPL